MTTWKMYRIAFRLLSPLHVGWFKQGNVQRTRPYLTGKALWGALTARLAREKGNASYAAMGQQVNDALAFSYFYPSTAPHCVTLWPWEQPQEFAWCCLNTYASTALNYAKNSAEEGSLHETEYISPSTREGEPVYLLGFVFEKAGCSLGWRDALHRLQLGGERTYGWGRVQVHTEPVETNTFWPGWTVTLTGDRPQLSPYDETVLYAHLRHSSAFSGLRGAVEPLVGRETQQAGAHGEAIAFHGLAWSPGAHLAALQRPLRVADFGLWQLD
ncbi:MAG: hypothetical protein RMJ85_13205 [Anaerolineales bacterium]|nr:hypothetical protein [Anaerolineales bacterium]